ncbi:hypothetical protein niasHT_025418 [Heterodera trifolii]|uniref:Uncharacterized protein n=1 Tax=Heterodera trifolii TaxID=157864 RepID=A0ABD2KEY1_9BILA
MLSIRIYAAWIIDILIKLHQIVKWNNANSGEEFEDLLAHIHFAWRRGIVATNAKECWQNANFDEALAPVRWRWLRLVILYKQIKHLFENHQFWVESVEDNVRNAADQLVEEHAKKMIRLGAKI